MTLDEFIEEEKRLLDVFKERWERRALEEPECFPLSMDSYEWTEQFEASK
jgi:hypothetical protein